MTGSLAELDAEITALEEELQAMKRARAILAARRGVAQVESSPVVPPTPPTRPVSISPMVAAAPQKAENNAGDDERGVWAEELRKLMGDGKVRRTSEIYESLRATGVSVTYAALATWLRRAGQRGEFTNPSRGAYQFEKGEVQEKPLPIPW